MKALGTFAFLFSVLLVLMFFEAKRTNEERLELIGLIDKFVKEVEVPDSKELQRSCYELTYQEYLREWQLACSKDPVFMYCSMEESILGSGCTSRAKSGVEMAKGDSLSEKRKAFCEGIRPDFEYLGVWEACGKPE